jgi:hypothetical protein
MKTDHLEGLGIDKRIRLIFILNKCDGNVWTSLIWFRIGITIRSCEHDNEPSDFSLENFSFTRTLIHVVSRYVS